MSSITKEDYESFVAGFADDATSGILRNGFALYLMNKHSHNVNFAAAELDMYFQSSDTNYISNKKAVSSNLKYLITKISLYKKRLITNWPRIQHLLREPAIVPEKRKRPSPSVDSVPGTSHQDKGLSPPRAKKLRFDCDKCLSTREEWSSKYKNLESKLKEVKVMLNTVSRKYKVRSVNRCNKRMHERIANLKNENSELKNQISAMQKSDNKVDVRTKNKHVTLNNVIERLHEQMKRVKNKMRACEEEKGELKAEIERLTLELSDREGITHVDSKTFSPAMRKCIYNCLLHQVPVEKAGMIIKFIIKELTGLTLSKVPCQSTIANMAYEMGILSDLQVGDVMFNSKNLTLSWDSTPLDGVCVNSCHISTGKENFTLQIAEMPGGKTEDYLQHLLNAIRDIAANYSMRYRIQHHMVLFKFFESLQATLTDRAKVNKCVSEQLGEMIGKQLIDLKCNLHPLDGMASEANKKLKELDESWNVKGKVFGKVGSAANLAHAISKLRYKKNTGDPAGFKAFLSRECLRKTSIPRYVGNRLNILFLIAGIVFKLKDKLILYLNRFCSSQKLRKAIAQDMSNPDIMSQIRALGIFGKLLTGPWMRLFFTKSDGLKNLDIIPYVEKCVIKLKEIEANPQMVLTMETDVFNSPLNTDDILQDLRNPAHQTTDKFFQIISILSSCFLAVLDRQLTDYKEGGRLTNLTPEEVEKTSSAPVHNIHSERVLGMVDSQFHRAPNATMGFIDAKVKCLANKTLSWLLEKPKIEQDNLIRFAIKTARKYRNTLEGRATDMRKTVVDRQIQYGQHRDKTERNQLKKKIILCLERDSVLIDEIFDSISTEYKENLSLLLLQTRSCLPLSIEHNWNVDGEDRLYEGKITEYVKKGKTSFCRIVYSEEDLLDISISDLITDVKMGDFKFL